MIRARRGEARVRSAQVSSHLLGQAEVDNLGDAVAGQEDVGGLQVAVHDPAAVGIRDRAGHDFHQGRGLRGPVGPSAMACFRLPLDKLEGDERTARGPKDLVDLHDVGVLEPRTASASARKRSGPASDDAGRIIFERHEATPG